MSKVITPEVSDRICAHMNEDHAATLHAVVLSNISNHEAFRCKVQNATMKSVTLSEYIIKYVLCDGDACMQNELVIPFDPPLQSVKAVRAHLIEHHHRALQPKVSWLLTDPVMRTLFGTCILLGVGTLMGQEELVNKIDSTSWANSIVTTIFGTSTLFAKLVIGSFYFSLLAHTMEACYTSYLCKTVLKMKSWTICKWFMLNVCCGFPIMNKIKGYVEVDNEARSKKKKER